MTQHDVFRHNNSLMFLGYKVAGDEATGVYKEQTPQFPENEEQTADEETCKRETCICFASPIRCTRMQHCPPFQDKFVGCLSTIVPCFSPDVGKA